MTLFALLAVLSIMPARPDVSRAVVRIYDDAFLKIGVRPVVEEAILVRRDGIEVVVGTEDRVDFAWSSGILAVIHTHPHVGAEQLSPFDVSYARAYHVPVYAVSAYQVWEATPLGEVRQLAVN